MTPRPEIFSVPGTLNLQEFTAVINEHAFSRVPVYSGSLDHVTGIAFARDLLKVNDAEAATLTVAQIQRPAAFVPETKKVAELLREMQREKQHMRIVIDEYGSVAGLVTIEDLLEAIVGNIADEHDEPEADDEPIREPNGAYVVSGSFELSRLRDLFADQFETNHRSTRPAEDGEPHDPEDEETESVEASYARDSKDDREDPELIEIRDTRDDPTALRLPEHYESTTLGGLVSEIAGHIPLPGEVVEEEGLRLEVLASTDRRIDRIRISLAHPPAAA
jgi:putative hemolysin